MVQVGDPIITLPDERRAFRVVGADEVKAVGNATFRQALEALPVAVYVTDVEGHITFYNDAAAELWGDRPVIGDKRWCGSWKLFNPDGTPLPYEECPMAQALKQGRAIRGVEAVAERPDGTRVAFLPFPTPLRDGSGRLIGAVNLLVDLADKRLAAEYERRLAAIVESSQDSIVSENMDGVITSWNESAELLFGYRAEEAIGRSITMLMPPGAESEEASILERVRRGERIKSFETVRRRKDGSLVPVSLTVSPIFDAEGRIVGASKSARDITERKRAQEQESLLQGELKHRLKNSFAIVQAMASQTLRSASPEELQAFIARLHTLASVHDALTLESWNRASLRDIANRALEPFHESHEARIVLDGPPVWLNSRQSVLLAMGLHELATNAVKYGALCDQGGQVRLEWSVERSGGDTAVRLRWSESGGPHVEPPERKGFGSKLIERAFEGEFGTVHFDYAPEGLICTLEMRL